MITKSRVRKDGATTRQRLVKAAEQLFAQRGVDNVSLVDIGRVAGQKNRSALQYHFGDKAGLINAVLDRHTRVIGERRRQRIDALQEGAYELRDLVEILVRPVAEHVETEEGGEAFVHINAQLAASRTHAAMRRDRVLEMPEVQQLNRLLAQKLSAMEEAELEARMLLVDCMIFSGLASYLSLAPAIGRTQFVTSLIDSICAMLSAGCAQEAR